MRNFVSPFAEYHAILYNCHVYEFQYIPSFIRRDIPQCFKNDFPPKSSSPLPPQVMSPPKKSIKLYDYVDLIEGYVYGEKRPSLLF